LREAPIHRRIALRPQLLVDVLPEVLVVAGVLAMLLGHRGVLVALANKNVSKACVALSLLLCLGCGAAVDAAHVVARAAEEKHTRAANHPEHQANHERLCLHVADHGYSVWYQFPEWS
tara:strand:+ start:259 stop:612 length:354 start_codon:yes stop_codon:yes gene_type:complete